MKREGRHKVSCLTKELLGIDSCRESWLFSKSIVPDKLTMFQGKAAHPKVH